MPASIIVANCREKTWSDFGLTFLFEPAEPATRSAAPTWRQAGRQQALGAQLLARRADVARLELTLELEALLVDRRVSPGAHVFLRSRSARSVAVLEVVR